MHGTCFFMSEGKNKEEKFAFSQNNILIRRKYIPIYSATEVGENFLLPMKELKHSLGKESAVVIQGESRFLKLQMWQKNGSAFYIDPGQTWYLLWASGFTLVT